MITLSIEHGFKRESRFYRTLPGGVATLQAATLSALALEAKTTLERRMPADIDRPTPFTRSSLVSYRASRRRLESGVFVKDRQADYLFRIVSRKRVVRRPQRRAIFVPAPSEKRNQFGNQTRARRRAVLNSPGRFVLDRGGKRAVFVRRGKTRQFVGSFVPRTVYARGPYWRFYETSAEVANLSLSGLYRREWDRAAARLSSR